MKILNFRWNVVDQEGPIDTKSALIQVMPIQHQAIAWAYVSHICGALWLHQATRS